MNPEIINLLEVRMDDLRAAVIRYRAERPGMDARTGALCDLNAGEAYGQITAALVALRRV